MVLLTETKILTWNREECIAWNHQLGRGRVGKDNRGMWDGPKSGHVGWSMLLGHFDQIVSGTWRSAQLEGIMKEEWTLSFGNKLKTGEMGHDLDNRCSLAPVDRAYMYM